MWVRLLKASQSRWQPSGVMESFLEEREEKSIPGADGDPEAGLVKLLAKAT